MLRILDGVPPGLLDVEPGGLAEVLGGPALLRVPGERTPPLLVATLLHGNETTGWNALRRVLRAAEGRPLPRALELFVANVEAARAGLRHLDGQPDWNRIWRGAPGAEAELAARVLAEAERARPLACIDVHNTSGENPLYACVHRLDDKTLALASRFSRRAVLVTHPESLLSIALARLAPSITLECGRPGDESVTRRVADLLGELLSADALAAPGAVAPELLRSVARVRVPDAVSFSFHDDAADLRLVPGLDTHNFRVMPGGTPIAFVRPGCDARLVALDEHGADVSDRYFRRRDDALVTAVPLIPSLFTPNERIIRQDCLCYVMERL